jgi:hypothetical protein
MSDTAPSKRQPISAAESAKIAEFGRYLASRFGLDGATPPDEPMGQTADNWTKVKEAFHTLTERDKESKKQIDMLREQVVVLSGQVDSLGKRVQEFEGRYDAADTAALSDLNTFAGTINVLPPL